MGYTKRILRFYFAPEPRSLGTLLYLNVFGYFTLFHIGGLFLAIRFIFYTLFGQTALTSTTYLFTGMTFVVCLSLPFFISLYSIIGLPRIWEKPTWSIHIKWLVTVLLALSAVIIIVIADNTARILALQSTMRSFVEDANLAGGL